MAEVETPAAHVVARRMALAAGCGGALIAAGALAILVALETRTRVVETLLGAVLCGSAGAAWCALFTLAEHAALRTRPVARLPVLALLGAGAGGLVCSAFVWVLSLARGQGGAGALEAIARLLGDALADPAYAIRVSAAVLAPFLAIGGARTLPLRGRCGWPLALEVVLAAGSGLVAALLLTGFNPSASRLIYLFTIVGAVAASLGLRLADHAEATIEREARLTSRILGP